MKIELNPAATRSKNRIFVLLGMAGAIILGGILRLSEVDQVFPSSDNAHLADIITHFPGYSWMAELPYGALIWCISKLIVGVVSGCGLRVDEFVWHLPMILVGIIQIPICYSFLRSLFVGRPIAVAACYLVACLPEHVAQSRYTWGYEVLGVLFLTTALWALIRFAAVPSWPRSVIAGLSLALYSISHGYIVPVLPFIILVHVGASRPWWRGIWEFLRKGVWVYPALCFPLYEASLKHTSEKKTQLGFYLTDHWRTFVGAQGYAYLAVSLLAFMLFSKSTTHGRRFGFLLFGGAGCYLAPLFFGATPGVTIVQGYFLIGVYLLVLGAVVILNGAVLERRRLGFTGVLVLVAVVTGTAIAANIFQWHQGFNFLSVSLDRGMITADPGSKAAGYILRQQLPRTAHVLALHRAIEPPNLSYYFDRTDKAFYDLTLADTRDVYAKFRESADVVLADIEQAAFIDADPIYERWFRIRAGAADRLVAYRKVGSGLPKDLVYEAEQLNSDYDHEYSPVVHVFD